MSYVLRKWYFDVLTGGGGYVFIYFAYMRMLGQAFRSLTFHAALPGRNTVSRSFLIPVHEESFDELSRGRIRLPCGTIELADDLCTLDLEQGDCRVHLRYSAGGGDVGEPVRIAAAARSHIVWKPVSLRYSVDGRVAIGGESVDCRDTDGYADVLECTCIPPLVPARTLYWGRVHAPGFAFSYCRASNREGDPLCSRIYLQRDGRAAESGTLSLLTPAGPAVGPSGSAGEPGYTLEGELLHCRIRASVRRISEVQHSGFIDHQEIRHEAVRALLRLITRNPRSTKYVSEGEIELTSGSGIEIFQNVRFIDETALL
jgi:hypothetical protein